jgi:1-acyl-sn-glycerol-3-phosphate acyltransferase
MSSQFKLLTERRFAPFFWTQFLGAGNDNLFKFSFTVMVTYGIGQAASGAQAGQSGLSAGLVVQLIAALFILPFIIFSATSGQLSDKYEKSALMRRVKDFEIVIMLAAYYGFATGNNAVLLACTFAMGLHSTLFGPVKYAYLPQKLHPHELTGGNGMVEMGTFVSILLGTLLGGVLIAMPGEGPKYAAAACVVVAVLGRVAVQFIPNSPATEPDLQINWNPLSETWKNLTLAKQSPVVFRCLIGISWLWFFGAVLLTQFPSLAKDTLKGNPDVATLLLIVFSLGIGLGSLACEMLSRRRVEIGLVPIGALGMTVFGVALYFTASHFALTAVPLGVADFWAAAGSWPVLACLFCLSFSAGLFSVPMYALIQERSPETHRARIIAANNIINALFMIASAGMIMLLQGVFKLTVPQIFLVTALLNVAVVAYVFILAPEFVLRFVSYFLAHGIYRFKVRNETHIPTEGACLLACNHVSMVDVLLLMAASPRPIYFVMDKTIYRMPLLHWLFKASKAIPIAPAHEDAALLEAAYRSCLTHLAAGDIVGIFPEGKITKTGQLNTFKHGITILLERSAAQGMRPPVIPMALQGLWGSYFSRVEGGVMSKPFRRGFFSRVTLNVGPAIPAGQFEISQLQATVETLKEGKQ